MGRKREELQINNVFREGELAKDSTVANFATTAAKEHLVRGYTLNQSRFEKNAAELEQALALIQRTTQTPKSSSPIITATVEQGLIKNDPNAPKSKRYARYIPAWA